MMREESSRAFRFKRYLGSGLGGTWGLDMREEQGSRRFAKKCKTSEGDGEPG